MKHTKGRFSIRKHPFIITFIIMAVIVVVVAVGYIDVNHRFPEPEEEIVEKDEWVQYSDGIKIKVQELITALNGKLMKNTAPVLRNWAGLII